MRKLACILALINQYGKIMGQQRRWYLYIIATVRGRLYTGITTDLERRFAQHLSGKGAKFFRTDPPLRRVYCRVFSDRASASREEYRIKQLSRTQKLRLICDASSGDQAVAETTQRKPQSGVTFLHSNPVV